MRREVQSVLSATASKIRFHLKIDIILLEKRSQFGWTPPPHFMRDKQTCHFKGQALKNFASLHLKPCGLAAPCDITTKLPTPNFLHNFALYKMFPYFIGK